MSLLAEKMPYLIEERGMVAEPWPCNCMIAALLDDPSLN